MLPVSLFLIEIIFYPDSAALKQYEKALPGSDGHRDLRSFYLELAIFKTGALDFLFSGFATRPFTLVERSVDRTENPSVLYQPDFLSAACQTFHNPRYRRFNFTVVARGRHCRAILTVLLLIGIGRVAGKKETVTGFCNFILFFEPCCRIDNSSVGTYF